MKDFVFPPPDRVGLAVEGTDARFPVRRIYCVGRNYAAHAREMGGDGRSPPFFFAKPADAVVASGGTVAYPAMTENLHHEMELVVALSGDGADVPVDRALDLVFGYAAGVDLTRRDLQDAAKDKRQPWEASKGFDASAPIGLIRPMARAGSPQGRISLSVNGQTRQDARLSDMIWSTAEIIAQVSRLWRLEAGDLIFTGTPEGVGPLVRGDRVEGVIEDVGDVAFTIG
jgi:fumarylpyruvate hydrolase